MPGCRGRGLAVLALGIVTPGQVRADVDDGAGLVLVAPPRRAVDVPTDTLIWIDARNAELHAGATVTVLVDEAGQRVGLGESSTITTNLGDVTVLRPLRLLQRDMDYGLWQCDERECLYELTKFHTGMGGAEGRPEVPAVTELREAQGGLVVDFEFSGVLVVSRNRVGLDAQALAGEVVMLGLPEQDVPLVLDRRVVAAKLGVFDLAGNFSGFTPLLDLDREASGCGACDVRGTASGGVLLVIGVVLLGRRRRR